MNRRRFNFKIASVAGLAAGLLERDSLANRPLPSDGDAGYKVGSQNNDRSGKKRRRRGSRS